MTQTLDPTSIITSDRQRTPSDLDPYFVASVSRRLIHPIVVRHEDDSTILVAGGRRLAALIQGKVSPLIENIHFRYIDDLSPVEAKVLELEENVKRADLPWRDQIRAIGELHTLYKSQNPSWSTDDTARELSVTQRWIHLTSIVYKNLENPMLRDATGIVQAYSILQQAAERKATSIINEITQTGAQLFNPISEVPNGTDNSPKPDDNRPDGNIPDLGFNSESDGQIGNPNSPPRIEPIPRPNPQPLILPPILCVDFLSWAKTYSGPKFTLIHCDFPFGIGVFQGKGMKPNQLGADLDYEDEPDSGVFWTLLDCLCENFDRLASYQSHLLFWFSMNHYERVRLQLEGTGLMVLNHPLIWHKSDDKGMIPGRGNHPRRVYETAFLCSLGQRPLMKKFSNCYSAPTTSNPIHPSQKPEPVLRFFFSGLVDETTDVLDPTCGSGSAIRAAEDCGARSVLGLELNSSYAETANATTLNARLMRKATGA